MGSFFVLLAERGQDISSVFFLLHQDTLESLADAIFAQGFGLGDEVFVDGDGEFLAGQVLLQHPGRVAVGLALLDVECRHATEIGDSLRYEYRVGDLLIGVDDELLPDRGILRPGHGRRVLDMLHRRCILPLERLVEVADELLFGDGHKRMLLV